MKLQKLAASLIAAAVTGAFGAAYAQGDSNVGMRNTDKNAPSSVQQDQSSSNSTDESSSPGNSSTPQIDRDPSAPSAPVGGTYRTDSGSGSGSSGDNPATPSQSGRQPAPY